MSDITIRYTNTPSGTLNISVSNLVRGSLEASNPDDVYDVADAVNRCATAISVLTETLHRSGILSDQDIADMTGEYLTTLTNQDARDSADAVEQAAEDIAEDIRESNE